MDGIGYEDEGGSGFISKMMMRKMRKMMRTNWKRKTRRKTIVMASEVMVPVMETAKPVCWFWCTDTIC